jgi:hypothetical protein
MAPRNRVGPGLPPGRSRPSVFRNGRGRTSGITQAARAAARRLCEQLACRDQLAGWDAWIASCLHDGTASDGAAESPPLPLRRLDPDALSNGALFAATLTLTAEQDLSGGLLGLAWLSDPGADRVPPLRDELTRRARGLMVRLADTSAV